MYFFHETLEDPYFFFFFFVLGTGSGSFYESVNLSVKDDQSYKRLFSWRSSGCGGWKAGRGPTRRIPGGRKRGVAGGGGRQPGNGMCRVRPMRTRKEILLIYLIIYI